MSSGRRGRSAARGGREKSSLQSERCLRSARRRLHLMCRFLTNWIMFPSATQSRLVRNFVRIRAEFERLGGGEKKRFQRCFAFKSVLWPTGRETEGRGGPLALPPSSDCSQARKRLHASLSRSEAEREAEGGTGSPWLGPAAFTPVRLVGTQTVSHRPRQPNRKRPLQTPSSTPRC